MKEYKNIFLKVDRIDPVYNGDGFCSRLTYLDGIKVLIGNECHHFECDSFTVCDPDAVREDGRRQVIALAKEIYELPVEERIKAFGKPVTIDILLSATYEDLAKKLDTWKKEKNAVHVRDEVTTAGVTYVVTRVYSQDKNGVTSHYVDGLTKGGGVIRCVLVKNAHKTGVHVDDLDSYLEV